MSASGTGERSNASLRAIWLVSCALSDDVDWFRVLVLAAAAAEGDEGIASRIVVLSPCRSEEAAGVASKSFAVFCLCSWVGV